MRYLNFRLQITLGPAGGFSVHALSPRGEGQSSFVSPFPGKELRALKAALWGDRLDCGSAGSPDHSPKFVGERLFEALFQGEVLRLYERSVDLLGTDAEASLRLELMLDPRDQDLAGLQTLPWELLRQPGTPELLALSRRRSVIRYLAVPRAVYAAPPIQTLRILAVAANPRHRHLEALDLAKELRNLEVAIGSAPNVEIVRVQPPTLAALRQACIDRECHVLHFMGHGGSAPRPDERVLFFETEDGAAASVGGTDLANKLADCPTVRLVVLNSCGSAALPDNTETDPLTGVASSLVLGGMPAVVAMQFPVSDEAAIVFSRSFYQQFAAGDPVEAAVAEGRQAMHSADPKGIEWAAPVLFLRGQGSPPEPSTRRKKRWLTAALMVLLLASMVVAGRIWRVERLVAEGVALFEHEQWPEARERFQVALKLTPRSAEVLSNLAATEERLGDVRSAEEHYREAARRRPTSAEHLFNLGHFLNGHGRYEDAYSYLQQAIEIAPGRVDAYGELARAALSLGMLDRARTALSIALRLESERPALHRLFGEVELRAGQPQVAIAHLEEARRRYPVGELGRLETSWLLVQAYERLRNMPSACREAREFRRMDGSGITPWAPLVEAVAVRSHCP